MTDRSDKKPTGGSTDGPGIQLRRAREARGLLLHDVAQELHLDEWMLQALEDDDFHALGAPVFAKGHMRKYGSMLGLSADDLMIAYYRKRGRDDSPPPITSFSAPPPPARKFPWAGLAWVLAAVLVVLLLFLLWARNAAAPDNQSTSAVDRSSRPVAAAIPAATQRNLSAATDAATDSASITEAEQSGAADPTPTDALITAAAAPPAVVDAPVAAAADTMTDLASPADATSTAATPVDVVRSVQVRISVDSDSWVEITDSEGNQLVYAMLGTGRVRTVSGVPPIEVFLGLSRVVRLEVDGEFYPVPRRSVRGNTARFVIDPDGR